MTDKPAGERVLPDPAKPKPGHARYIFVDLLRGLALIVMIETHVINAYLPAVSRHTEFFFWLSFVNGLVAPAFLFASGFSLVLQAHRNWEAWLRFGPALRKQMRRLGFILLVAYYLHLPYFGISKFLKPQELGFWKTAFQVDVLHCIVISLLAADLLILLTRHKRLFVWAAAMAGMCAALATPWMWSQDFTARLPLGLALFLNPHGISLFPLFPWISFVMAGCCAAHLFLESAAKQEDGRYMRRALMIAAASIAVALALRQVPWLTYWSAGFYRVSPLYVVIRIACVLAICAGLYFMEKRLGWVPRAIRLAGQESLLVYTAHLAMIYGILRRTQLSAILGRELGYAGSFLLSAVLIALNILLAGWWHSLKKNRPRAARTALFVLVALSVIIFLWN